VILILKLQRVHKERIHSVGLLHDKVQQLFGCLDGLAVSGLNGFQLPQRESVRLKHLASNALCV